MGRLSDARKKAKKSGDGDNRRPPEGAPAGAPPSPSAAPEQPAPSASALADEILAGLAEPAPDKPAPAAASLPSSGLADEILAGAAEAPPAAPSLPSSGLADDILAAAEAPPAKPAMPSSGLADEILAAAAAVAPPAPAPAAPAKPDPSDFDDEDATFGGFAAPAPRTAAPASLPSSGLADELLAQLAAAPAPKQAVPAVEAALASGVLDALDAGAAPANGSLGSSGLAEDVLRAAPAAAQGKHHLALDEIREFETFFENESEVEQLHLVLFHMGDEVFALDIDRVQEIIRVPGVTRVPHVAGHVLGVCNLRGRIVPVFELRKLMRMASRPVDRLSRILVLDFAGKQIGMLVDRANEVAHIRVSDIEPPPDEVRAVDRNLVTAVARLNARMVFILDLDQVLAMK